MEMKFTIQHLLYNQHKITRVFNCIARNFDLTPFSYKSGHVFEGEWLEDRMEGKGQYPLLFFFMTLEPRVE